MRVRIIKGERKRGKNRAKVGDELQLKNYKAGIASPFEKNSPPEVSRVTTGVNHH